MREAPAVNSPLDLVTDPPISRVRVLRISLAGFGLIVGLVLLAGYLGYRGSTGIQNAAQSLIREHLLQSERGAQVEALIVRQSQELIDGLAWVLGICAILAVITAGIAIWILQRAFSKLEWQAAELARVSWHMIDAYEKISRRFSHEMHDELGQSLSGLRRMLSRPEAEFGAVRQECIGIVDEVIENVRKLSQALRPVILDDFGLDPALRWLCDRFTQRTQIPVEYVSNFKDRLAERLETHLFRIAQEALTNIARHSEASRASISLHVDRDRVELCITDNGRGITPQSGEARSSLGMVGMRARARQLGGEFTVENQKGGGLRIHVTAPLQQAERDEQEDSSVVG